MIFYFKFVSNNKSLQVKIRTLTTFQSFLAFSIKNRQTYLCLYRYYDYFMYYEINCQTFCKFPILR